MTNEDKEAMDAVANTLDRVSADGRDILFTLKNGIVLRCISVPPFYIDALQAQYAMPEPPKVTVDRGDGTTWEEENANDPEYQREFEKQQDRLRLALNALTLVIGTRVHFVPESLFGPDDDRWIETATRVEAVSAVKVPIDVSTDDMRRLSWLRYYALDNNDDIQIASALPSLLAGLQEGEVAAALDAFRNVRRRRTDTDGAVVQPIQDGPANNRAGRRASTRGRGTPGS